MGRAALGILALGAALSGFAVPAAAQDPAPPAAAEPELTEIEVLSQREMARQVFKDNLRQMTERLSVFESMPRFFDPLCIDVAGMAPEQARFVADRIQATARDLGLGEPREGCRANVVVMVVRDPARMFKTLLGKRPDMVGILPFRDVHSRRIENELRARRPVVWWSVLGTANAQGPTFNELGLPIAQNVTASRTQAPMYTSKNLSVVMYDADQLGGASIGQIADHAALHILGMPRRQIAFAGVGLPTMLSLFESGPDLAPEALTDFDRAYLRGLYSLDPGSFQVRVPRAVVAAYAAQCKAEDSDCRIRLRN